MKLLCVFAGLTLAVLGGCATPSSLSAEEAARISSTDLCRMNEETPFGFIPLEVERRKLDCKREHRALLDEELKQDNGILYLPPRVPRGALNDADCKGIRLGAVRTPYVTETRTANTASGTSDSRFHQHVVNTTPNTVYVLFTLSWGQGESGSGTKLVRVLPQSDTVVRFGLMTRTVVKVAISACRVFAV